MGREGEKEILLYGGDTKKVYLHGRRNRFHGQIIVTGYLERRRYLYKVETRQVMQSVVGVHRKLEYFVPLMSIP